VAESVIFAEMLDTLSRAKGAGIPPLRRGRCRLTGGMTGTKRTGTATEATTGGIR
jgi:hypothetical protein